MADTLAEEFEGLEAEVRVREAEGFDLSAAEPVAAREDEGLVVHVHGPDGGPLYFGGDKPVTVTVAGTYSARYRRAEEAVATRRLKARRASLDAAGLRRDALEVQAACVLAWSGFFRDGKPIDCTKDNVIAALKAAPWLQTQIETAMEDHAGFFQGSSTS